MPVPVTCQLQCYTTTNTSRSNNLTVPCCVRTSLVWHGTRTQHVDKPHLTSVRTMTLIAVCPCQKACKQLGYTCRGCTCPYALNGCTPLSTSQHQSRLSKRCAVDQNISSFTQLVFVSPLTCHHIAFHCACLCDQSVDTSKPGSTGLLPMSRVTKMTWPPGSAFMSLIHAQGP